MGGGGGFCREVPRTAGVLLMVLHFPRRHYKRPEYAWRRPILLIYTWMITIFLEYTWRRPVFLQIHVDVHYRPGIHMEAPPDADTAAGYSG